MSVECFLSVGFSMMNGATPISPKTRRERWKAYFKAHPLLCSKLFQLIVQLFPPPNILEPKHLLWTLYFLNNYPSQRKMAVDLGTNRESMRAWVWPVIKELSSQAHRVVSSFCYSRCGSRILFGLTLDSRLSGRTGWLEIEELQPRYQ